MSENLTSKPLMFFTAEKSRGQSIWLYSPNSGH